MDWTTEQILGLAPDQFTLRAGRGLADPLKWIALHQDGETLWGIHPNGRNKTGETAVYLPTNTYFCTCNSRKAPCRHSLALRLLWQQQTHPFTQHPTNRPLAAWVKREQLKQQRGPAANGRLAPLPNLARLNTGLHELELWLLDMVRHGLARLPERAPAYWNTMAHRLVDAQAAPLAQTVRQLAQIPKSYPNWPDQILQEIGRLYLIIQGFRNFEQLPVPVQADLQSAVGWLPAAANNTSIFTDHWRVLGRQQEKVGGQTRHSTWLWGQQAQLTAQRIDLSRGNVAEGIWLPTDTVWHGSLQFVPSSWPQVATAYGNLTPTATAASQPSGFKTIHAATQAYGQALAVNPWLPDFPMLLHGILPAVTETGWQIQDEVGTHLPLPEKFLYGWHLLGLAGGTPSLTLFGVWNGRFLQPLTVQIENEWQDLHVWRGMR
jgi:hypothetical protein